MHAEWFPPPAEVVSPCRDGQLRDSNQVSRERPWILWTVAYLHYYSSLGFRVCQTPRASRAGYSWQPWRRHNIASLRWDRTRPNQQVLVTGILRLHHRLDTQVPRQDGRLIRQSMAHTGMRRLRQVRDS